MMENLNFSIQKLEKDEKGQGAAEYILLFGGVIIIAIVALIIYKSYFGNGTTDLNASKDVNEVRNMIKSWKYDEDKMRKEFNILNEESGQSSAELMLLVGTIIVIVLLVGVYVTNILHSIDNGLKNLVENGRDSLINRL